MQLAQHFYIQEKGAFLTHLKICAAGNPLFNSETNTFRIRIYARDSLTGAPSNDLCNQTIQVTTKKQVIKLNLEKYNIYIPSRDFFVAIEWLIIPANEERRKVKFGEI